MGGGKASSLEKDSINFFAPGAGAANHYMKKLLTFALAAALGTAAMTAGNPTMYAVYGWANTGSYGVYTITPETFSTPTLVYQNNSFSPIYVAGGVFYENKFISNVKSYSASKRYTWTYSDINDATTWQKEDEVVVPVTSCHTALALGPQNKIYGAFYNENGSSYYFGTFDPETNETSKICELPEKAYSLAINEFGMVYWIALDGTLYEGSVFGDFSKKANLGITLPSGDSSYGAVIDPSDNIMYWSTRGTLKGESSQSYYFCTVDIENGTMTAIKNEKYSPYYMANVLYIPTDGANEDAPNAPTDLKVTADGFSTNLTVSFTMPTAYVSGMEINDPINAYVAVDGKVVYGPEGTTAGATVTANINVTDGQHLIAVYAETIGRDGGERSEIALQPFFAGQDRPEAVGNLAAEKTPNAINLSWTAPEKGVGGGNFDTETLYYTVTLLPSDSEEGEVVADNLKDCEFTFELENSDLRFLQFEVTPKTSAVVGDAAITDLIVVGEDLPAAVQNLTAEKTDGTIVLTWEAPASGANGSDYDAASLTYKVVLLPETVLVENTTETSYTFTLESEEIQTYQFAVTPVTRKGEGPTTQTAKFAAGSYYAVPFVEDFNGKTLEETGFAIFDVNEDGSTWAVYTSMGYLRYSFNRNNVANDWIITAPIKLEAGKRYSLSYDILLNYSDPEKLTVYIGKEQTVAGMTSTLKELTTYTKDKTEDVFFNVEEDGIYYIGFHCTSDAYMGYLNIDNLSIDFAPTAAPAAATELSASLSGASGTISFLVPTTTADGGSNPKYTGGEITLDGSRIKTIDAADLVPGERYSFVFNHTGYRDGVHTYGVTLSNAVGTSEEATLDIRVGDPTAVPAAAEKLTAVCDENGHITLTFTVPTTDVNGEADPKITSARIYRNESLIKEFERPTHGSVVTHVDEDTNDGDTYKYHVEFENAAGTSEKTIADDVTVSGIGSVESDGVKLSVVEGGVVVTGSDAMVYNTAGLKVAVAKDGEFTALAAGLYVVKAEGLTAKVAVK